MAEHYAAGLLASTGVLMSDVRCIGSDLCEELAGLPDSSFQATYQGDPLTRVITKSEHLRLMVDLSPLTAGHMLLVPATHYLSFAQVLGDWGHELDDLLKMVLPLYNTTFGRPAILEHGSSTAMDTAACVTHAHWHLVPCDGSQLDRRMTQDGLIGTRLESPHGLTALANIDEPYFYCSHGASHTVFGVGSTMRRQYLRSIVGQLLGIEDPLWDYALVVRKELLRETIRSTSRWPARSDAP